MPWKSDNTYCLASLWFLRLLGFIYLCAFVSLWVQLEGLIGTNGILPAHNFLEAVRNHFEGRLLSAAIWKVPSVFLFNSSDSALHFGCALGCAMSCLIMLGILAPLTSLALWALYLSFATVAGTFFGFQWDNLLLEVGFLAIFLSPLKMWPRLNEGWKPNVWVLWLFRFLLFRLMFSSGWVKIEPEGTGPNTWADLTAMNFHYETQPLPTIFAWYAHQLPEWFDRMSVVMTLFIQIVIPFLVFGPRLCRRFACLLLISLQVLILVTGNYCFFNLLAIALCLLLLDDRALRRFLTGWLCKIEIRKNASTPVFWARRLCAGLMFTILCLLGFYQLISTLSLPPDVLEPVAWMNRQVAPFRSVNAYGLFANMTTSRPEIVVQGSRDGRVWEDYAFEYKPGELGTRPRWNAPHQPRLDWQMWFAALGDIRSSRNQWFLAFVQRLLEGREEVTGLLRTNPFNEKPPKYIRALVYDYRFTKWGEENGDWWRRGTPKVYCPPVSLDESGRLSAQNPNS